MPQCPLPLTSAPGQRMRAEKAVRGAGAGGRGVEGQSDARAVLDAAMSEKELQALVIGLACKTGWLIHHQIVPFRIADGRHIALTEDGTDKGFPDLVLIHPERRQTIFPELKTMAGKLSRDQERWRDAILAVGGDWRLWRPCHWESEIEPTLKGEM